MESYAVLRMPKAIYYGRSSFEKVGTEAAIRGTKALVISDKIMDKLGYVSECRTILQQAKIESAVYLGVDSEPTDVYVQEALDLFTSQHCDVIIAIGGGSCIDTAKAVAVVSTNKGYIGDYMGGKKIATKAAIPLIAIPTTSGTGSEATDVTVINNTSNDVKMMIKQPAFMPEVSIVDPILTQSAPQKVTAATGVDALCHAIEAYISRLSHPLSDTFALSAMKLIVNNLRKAYTNGNDLDAREAMSLGALQAGMAFSNASVCLVHGMSRPIGALFHIPHGVSNAMLLPAVLEFSKDACVDRLADLGRIFNPNLGSVSNEEAANVAVEEVKRLCLDLNIPNLKDWGINEGEFESAIQKMAIDAIDSGSPGNNPRVPSQEEIIDLYRICYDYQYITNKVTK